MHADASQIAPSATRDWRKLLALFFVVGFVETYCVGHIHPFAPLFLQRELGLGPEEVPFWTGLVSSGHFLLGLPFVPFWGVLAERYGRGPLIARSALVQALVLVLVALSRTPYEFAASTALAGFQLGSTGIMYAALSHVAPRERVGFALALAGVAGPLGFAVGPAVAGPIADAIGLRPLYIVDAALCLLSALAVTVLFRERPSPATAAAVAARASVWREAWESVTGVLRARPTRLVFLVYVSVFLGRQISNPFIPLRVQEVFGSGEGLATAVGLVAGGGALAGAVFSPLAGALGDRLGYTRVLIGSMSLGALGAGLMAVAPSLPVLAVGVLAVGGGFASSGAMCVALLATLTTSTQRSSALNLALLPLYVGGIVGPAIGAALSVFGLRVVFLAAAVPPTVGALVARTIAMPRREARQAEDHRLSPGGR